MGRETTWQMQEHMMTEIWLDVYARGDAIRADATESSALRPKWLPGRG